MLLYPKLMNVKIRKITEKDIPHAAKLIHSMWLDHVSKAPGVLKRHYIESFDVQGYVRKYTASKDSAIFVAVDEQDGVVGVARVEIKPAAEGMYDFDKYAYFDDLVVDPQHQRQGIATLLTQARIDFTKSKGVTVCESRIYNYNTASQATAKKSGFEPIYSSYYKFLG